MDKAQLLNQIVGKDNSEKWYLTGFLAVMMLFVVFVISPNVNEYLRRMKLLEDIKGANEQYDVAINNLRELQKLFEQHRGRFGLLNEAIPNKLNAYNFAQEVSSTFLPYTEDSSISFSGFDVGKKSSEQIQAQEIEEAGAGASTVGAVQGLMTYDQSIDVQAKYSEIQRMITDLMKQRRIKHITRIALAKDSVASGDSKLNLKIDFMGYYSKD